VIVHGRKKCFLPPMLMTRLHVRGHLHAIASKCRRAIRMFDNANSVSTYPVFFAKPR
jgi:hypothetical protein